MVDWLDKTLWIVGAAIMSLVVVAATIYLSFILIYKEIPVSNRDIVLQMIGGYSALLGVIVKVWLDMVVRIFTVSSMQPTTVVTQQTGTQEIKT